IGQDGKNSEAYIAHDSQLNAQVVVKKIAKKHLVSVDEYFTEAKTLYLSAHPNVVQIHYACQDEDHIYIAMPYYAKGSLKKLMSTRHLTVR
ncbi:serine/threonine protein kinase, partial [Stenotrophomonas maltophilia]